MFKKWSVRAFLLILLTSLVVPLWYFCLRGDYFLNVSVVYSRFFNNPCIELEVEGAVYLVLIDSAASSEFTLNKESLAKMSNKQFIGTQKWIDFRGNQYESARYLVPEMKIKKMKINNAVVKEESVGFLTAGAIVQAQRTKDEVLREFDGRMGLGMLEKLNWLFDFSNNVMIASSKISNLTRKGYFIDRFLKIPMKINNYGMTLCVDTDAGQLTLLLDTGSGKNLIKPSLIKDKISENTSKIFKTSNFFIGGRNYGEQNFYPFEFSDFWDGIDGVIGMDFLKAHIFYLDFKNQLIYIGDSQEVSLNEYHSSAAKKPLKMCR